MYDFCVVQNAEGEEVVGYVDGFTYRCDCQHKSHVYPPIVRRADPREVRAWHFLQRREVEALTACKDKVEQHKLDMRVSQVKFDDRQRKVVFYFTADKRVDFRELVKDLAATFRARIELWQIGVRDETRQLGGMGVCGIGLCCATWLKEFLPVSIKYAKAQDIPFSPAKLSGVCGRLRCCLAYEHDQYKEMSKGVPPVGATVVSSEFGEARVIDRNLLSETLQIQDSSGQARTISFKQVERTSEGSGKAVWRVGEAPEEEDAPDEDDFTAQPIFRSKGGESPPRPRPVSRASEAAPPEQKPSAQQAETEDAPAGDDETKSKRRRRRRPRGNASGSNDGSGGEAKAGNPRPEGSKSQSGSGAAKRGGRRSGRNRGSSKPESQKDG
ncbi:hypothetical protein HQ520_14295 [bacterium]|nr:hypothetical protein [bacterium]